MGDTLIVVHHVSKTLSGQPILRDVSLTVEPGQLAAVIGPSGSGKTMLARCIVGLAPFEDGVIDVGDMHIAAGTSPHSSEAIAVRGKVGLVFQDLRLWPYRTALENIAEGLLHVRGASRSTARRTVDVWAERLGIATMLDKYPAALSGGERQRVAIARAAVMNPQYLILDEITSALDPVTAGAVSAVLLTLKDQGMGMLLMSHQIEFIRRCADSVTFLQRGSVVERGAAAQMLGASATEPLREFLSSVRRGW